MRERVEETLRLYRVLVSGMRHSFSSDACAWCEIAFIDGHLKGCPEEKENPGVRYPEGYHKEKGSGEPEPFGREHVRAGGNWAQPWQRKQRSSITRGPEWICMPLALYPLRGLSSVRQRVIHAFPWVGPPLLSRWALRCGRHCDVCWCPINGCAYQTSSMKDP